MLLVSGSWLQGWFAPILTGTGIVLIVNAVMGVGWPWTLVAGALCFFAGYVLAFGLKRSQRGP